MAITKEIVVTICRSARFLRYNKEAGAYEELSHLEARDKTSHALRTACKRVNKQTKNKIKPATFGSSSTTIRPATVLSSSIMTSPIRHCSSAKRYQESARLPPLHRYNPRPGPPGYDYTGQYQPLSLHEDRVEDGTMFGDLMSLLKDCLLYTSPSPRDQRGSRMPSSA